MNLHMTGRILKWFCRDLSLIAPTIRLGPQGLLSYPTPGVGRSVYWRLPHPLHPLEAVASMRGMGFLETGDPAVDGAHLIYCGGYRTVGWEGLTASIAEALFVPVQTARLVWHLLTPIAVSGGHPPLRVPAWKALRWARDRLWDACGHVAPETLNPPDDAPRRALWGKEIRGDIEL